MNTQTKILFKFYVLTKQGYEPYRAVSDAFQKTNRRSARKFANLNGIIYVENRDIVGETPSINPVTKRFDTVPEYGPVYWKQATLDMTFDNEFTNNPDTQNIKFFYQGNRYVIQSGMKMEINPNTSRPKFTDFMPDTFVVHHRNPLSDEEREELQRFNHE